MKKGKSIDVISSRVTVRGKGQKCYLVEQGNKNLHNEYTGNETLRFPFEVRHSLCRSSLRARNGDRSEPRTSGGEPLAVEFRRWGLRTSDNRLSRPRLEKSNRTQS